ncbi:MAG: hypothetical protein ACI9DJ_000571 [Algoriphagus sp.]
MLKLKITFIFLIIYGVAEAQSPYLGIDQDYNHLIERFEAKSGQLANNFHSNLKPFEREQVVRFIDSLDLTDTTYSKIDRWNSNYLKIDSWSFAADSTVGSGKPFLKRFFKKQSDFYFIKNDDYEIHVSPIFHFGGGKNSGGSGEQGQFINTRGISIRGSINNKFGFYTDFTENQESSPFYVKQYYGQTEGFPYTGFTKIVGDDVNKLTRDYVQANGYIVFEPSKHINLRFGHSKNFVGSGIRSMILSDFSAPYLNLIVNLKLGRLEYQNMIARMSNTQVDIGVNDLLAIPPKYMAFHHLNMNVSRRLNIGLFETVMFGGRSFDMNYLNPIIFYRFVEGLIGSSDNSIVGVDFKLLLSKSFIAYGQFVLDEFNSKERQNQGWYGEKNAGQLGLKYIDFAGLKNFDVQGEFNYARPYTYSHFSDYSSLVNYNVPITHPLGANFKEFLFVARYQPFNRLFVKATFMRAIKGYDIEGLNWGGDILKSYRNNRPKELGNFISQGDARTIMNVRAEASYMLLHNLFLDVSFQSRNEEGATFKATRNTLFNFGVRWNANILRPLL